MWRFCVTTLAKLLEAALFASGIPVPVESLRLMASHVDDTETTLDEALEEFEKLYIEKAYTRNKKRISHTAAALGFTRIGDWALIFLRTARDSSNTPP